MNRYVYKLASLLLVGIAFGTSSTQCMESTTYGSCVPLELIQMIGRTFLELSTGSLKFKQLANFDNRIVNAFSPNGEKAVVRRNDHNHNSYGIEIIETSNPESVLKLEGIPEKSYICSAAWSLDGTKIIISFQNGIVHIWNALTGERIFKLESGSDDIIFSDTICSVGLSYDGKIIITGSCGSTICLWSGATGELLQLLENPHDLNISIRSAALSSDGKIALIGYEDGMIYLWDTDSGNRMGKLEGHTASIASATFSDDGKKIVTGSYDKTAKLWDSSSKKLICTTAIHPGRVCSATFHPQAKTIITSSQEPGLYNHKCRLWSMYTGKFLKELNEKTIYGRSPVQVNKENGSITTLSRSGFCKWDFCYTNKPIAEWTVEEIKLAWEIFFTKFYPFFYSLYSIK